jgi:hypothetical protein
MLDTGGGAPTVGEPRVDDEGGRGLSVIRNLAKDCGSERLGQLGKAVWFEIGL